MSPVGGYAAMSPYGGVNKLELGKLSHVHDSGGGGGFVHMIL